MKDFPAADLLVKEIVIPVEPPPAAQPVPQPFTPEKNILPLCRLWLTPAERKLKPLGEMTPDERSRHWPRIKQEKMDFYREFREHLGLYLSECCDTEMKKRLAQAVEQYYADAKDLYGRLLEVEKYWEVRVIGDQENGIIPQLDNLRVAPIFLKEDAAFIDRLLSKDPHVIGYVSDAFKMDRKTVINAVKASGGLLMHMKDEFKRDREVVLAALANDGMAIQYVGENLRDDKEVALAAVRQNGLALQYVGEALKREADWEIIIAAIEQNPQSIIYAGERFFGGSGQLSASGDERPFCEWHQGEHEISSEPAAVPDACLGTGCDVGAILEIGLKYPRTLDYFVEGHPIWDNEEFVWGLIDKTNRIPKRIGMKLRNDPGFILTLMKKRSKKLGDGRHDSYVLFNYAGSELRGHSAFLEKMLMFRVDVNLIAAWISKDDFFVQPDFDDLDIRR